MAPPSAAPRHEAPVSPRAAGAATRRGHARLPFAFTPAFTRLLPAMFLRGICRRSRVLCLTFDDGPGVELTHQLAEMLKAWDAFATFFAVGERAARHPEVLDHLADQGHEIGCHTERHLSAWKSSEAAADIRGGYDALARWVAQDGLFRPPYGKMSLGTMREIRQRGAGVGWWTIDGGDTHAKIPPAGVAEESLRRRGGGVLLLHDFDRERDRAPRHEFVLRTTEAALKTARQEGIGVVLLGDLLLQEASR